MYKTAIYLTLIITATLTGSSSLRAAETPAPRTSPSPADAPAAATGYMIQTEFTEVTVDIMKQVATEKKVKNGSAIGRFDFSKDTLARFNLNFEDSRSLDAPEPFKQYRISCYSIRQDEKNVKLVMLVEKFTTSWEVAASASSVVAIGTPFINLRAIPVTHDFDKKPLNLKYIELGVNLYLGEIPTPPGGHTVHFTIPTGRHSESVNRSQN